MLNLFLLSLLNLQLLKKISELSFRFVLVFRFSSRDVEEEKEVGWKYIYGDVFRYPSETSLFCAILGAGTQFFIL